MPKIVCLTFNYICDIILYLINKIRNGEFKMSLSVFIKNILHEHSLSQKAFADLCTEENVESGKLLPTELSRVLINENKLPPEKVLNRLEYGLQKIGYKKTKSELIKIFYDHNDGNDNRLNNENEKVILYNYVESFCKEYKWTYDEVAKAITENDKQLSRNLYEDEEEYAREYGDPDIWTRIIRMNPKSMVLYYVMDENNKPVIVGDLFLVFLKPEFYAKRFYDAEIKPKDTESTQFPGDDYKAYLLGWIIMPEYNTIENQKIMIYSFLQRIKELAFFNGAFIQKMRGKTHYSAKFFLSLGFTQCNQDKTGNSSFKLDEFELSDFINDFEIKEEKYSECRKALEEVRELYNDRTHDIIR